LRGPDIRSKRVVLVPFCCLIQGVRAQGIVCHYPAVVTPVVEMLVRNNIGIIQMPCPELYIDNLERAPCGKQKYDQPRFREVYRRLAQGVVKQIVSLRRGGFHIEAILGVEYSPSCAIAILSRSSARNSNGKGVFTEELLRAFSDQKEEVPPMLGIENYQIGRTESRLAEILRKGGGRGV